MIKNLTSELQALKNPEKISVYQNFFKTKKWEYGYGDIFLGLTAPQQRWIAKKYLQISLEEISKLLENSIHEYRFTALVILNEKFSKGSHQEREKIFHFYISHARRVNNWDLVDVSSHKIIGIFLLEKKNRDILYTFSRSENLWERRISIISCLAFIRNHDFEDALKISKILLQDSHNLIHKAVGWMLREIGKRDQETEEIFLKKYAHVMPRMMLRYAIEKFTESERKKYMDWKG